MKESPVKRLTASSSHDCTLVAQLSMNLKLKFWMHFSVRKSPRARPPQSYTSAFRPASVNSLASTSKESDQLSLAEPFVSPIKITRQSAKEFLFKDVLTESPVQLTTPCKDGPSPKRLKIVFRLSSTKKPANEAVWHRTPLKSTGKKEKNNGQLHSTGKRSPVEAVVEVPRVPVRKNLSSCFSSPKKPTTSESGTIVSSPLKRSLRSDSRAIAAEIPVSTVSYQLPKESAESYRKYVEHLQMEKIGNGEEEVFYGRGTLRYSVFHGEYSGVYDDTNKQKKSKLNADDSVDHMASYLLNVYNPQPLNPVRFDKFKSPIKASRFGSRRSRLRSPQKVQDCQQHQLESPGSPTIKLINIATFFKTEKTTDSHTNCLSERKLSLRMSPDMLQPKSPKSSREHSYNCRSKGKVSIDIDESDEEEFT